MDTTNAIEAIRQLSPDDIRKRLSEIDREAKSLRVLLRASLAARTGRAANGKDGAK